MISISKNLVLGMGVLVTGLAVADQGADPRMDTRTPENTASYEAGYDFGRKLALLRQQQPDIKLDEALRGMLDALSETSTRLQAAENNAAKTDQVNIPARTGPYKDDFAALNARREGVVLLPSGVQYEVLKQGSGKQPGVSDVVLVNYQASLTNGIVFDTTYDNGEALSLSLDKIVVPGLKEALLLMNEGAKWRVVIPPSMGFGRFGNNQLRRRDLIYEIELVSVEQARAAKP